MGGHAQRLVVRIAYMIGTERKCVTLQFVRRVCVKFETARCSSDIDFRFLQRLAAVEAFHHRQPCRIRVDQLGGARQNQAAFRCPFAAPALLGAARGIHRPIDIADRPRRKFVKSAARSGIEALHPLAIGRGNPLSVDEVPVGKARERTGAKILFDELLFILAHLSLHR